MNPRILLAPAAAGKTEYCLNQIHAARKDEPLAPIWVILPDAAQVRAFRRRLARHEANGAFNVHVVTFSTLYAEVLALTGESWPRLDEPVLHRLLRMIVDELVANGRLSYYAPLQDKPGFFHALRNTIRELKRAAVEPDALTTAVSDQSLRLQELALIYGRYQQWLQEKAWADDEGRGWLAAIALAENPALCTDWRLLLVDGFDEFNPTQLAVLGHLAKQAQETVATLTGSPTPRLAHRRFDRARDVLEETLGVTAAPLPDGDVQLAPPLAHLEATLFTPDAPDPPLAGNALSLVAVPNRAHEVRAALRWLKRRHVEDGIPLHRLALLIRDLEAYRPFLAEVADEFGLPLQLSHGTWLDQNPAVAALLDLLALPRRNWPRRLLLEAWRSPYFDWRHAGITSRDAELLAAAAREGQIIAGLDQWHEVLNRLAQTASDSTADEGLEEMAETAVLTAPRGPQAAALRQKFDAFVRKIRPEPQATLRHYVRWLEVLVGDDPDTAPAQQPWQLGDTLGMVQRARYGPDNDALPTAERDVAALQRLKDVLRSLVLAESELGAGDPIPYSHFWQELRGAAEATSYKTSSAHTGALLAAPVLAARGLSFYAVALLGLSEGEFPRRQPHDPLLREPDRELLQQRDVRLETRDGGDEVTIFYEAVTRAQVQLLVTRAYLADDGQPWEPSPYWDQLTRHSRAEPITIRSADVLPPHHAASEPELLAALAHYAGDEPTAVAYHNHLPHHPTLHDGWQRVQVGAAVLAARTAATARGQYEGDLSHLQPWLTRRYGLERPWSASRLESYALCGFAFFAGYALGFEPRQPVAAGYDVRQLGSMFHAILEDVYKQAKATGQTAVALLPAIAEREFDAAPDTYGFRPTALWQQQRQELTQILLNTVKALDEASDGWQPLELEPPFGLKEIPPLQISDDQGRTLWLRGYIDRVDVDGNGRLRIIDYKSSNTPIASRALAEGKRIQLALYALAARDVLDLGEPAAGFYWHIGSAKPSHLRLEKEEGGVATALETAVDYALTYADAIRRGNFAPEPPDGGCPDYCPAADFCWRYTPRGF